MEDYSFKFSDYKLTNLNFLSQDVVSVDKDVHIDPKFSLSHEYQDKNLNVFFGISLDNKEIPFKFNIKIVGLFEFKRNIEEIKNIDSIIRVNCSAILYPFLRENIAEITRRAGHPPLILPPVNFQRIYQEASNSEE